MNIIKFLKKKSIKSNTDIWLNERKSIITATNVNCIIENDYKKLLKKKLGIDEKNENYLKFTQHGIEYEKVAINIFEKKKKVKVHELGLVKHEKYNWLGATPDGIFIENGKPVLLEIKNPVIRKITGDIPLRYLHQILLQMEVCNIDKCYYYECKIVESNIKNNVLSSDFYGYSKNRKIYWKLVKDNLVIIHRSPLWFKKNLKNFKNFYKYLNDKKTINNINNLNKRKRDNDEYSSLVIKRLKNKQNLYTTKNYKNIVYSFSNLKNYIENNSLVDWLNMYGHNFNIKKNDRDLKNVIYSIEKKKYKLIEDIICNTFFYEHAKISNNFNKFNKTLYYITKDYIKNNIPIIINPLLFNKNLKLYNNANIIILNGYLYQLIKMDIFKVDKNINIEKLNNDSNKNKYTIISTNIINNLKNNLEENNANMLRNIFNKCLLENTCGYKINYIYNIRHNCINVINLKNTKNLFESKIIKKAISWNKKLISKGGNFKISDIGNIKELFPNYVTEYIGCWKNFIQKMALKNKEISCLWGIGNKLRKKLIKNNITKYTKIRKKDLLNIFKKKTNYKYQIIDKILDINRSKNNIYPKNIKNNTNFDWIKEKR